MNEISLVKKIKKAYKIKISLNGKFLAYFNVVTYIGIIMLNRLLM